MAKKKKTRHDLWKRLSFKYRVAATNENTLEEIWKIRTSMFHGIVICTIFAFIVVFLTSAIIIATPIRYYLPGYMDSEIRGQAIKTSILADSLEQQLSYQEAYIANLKSVFSGELQVDSVKTPEAISISKDNPLLKKSKAEEEFTQRYAEEEKYNLSVLPQNANNPMDGVVFFKPTKGLIAKKIDSAKKSYGLEIKIISNENIFAVLEGTVIFSGYDATEGNIIQIQHKNGFISTYKHLSTLLKRAGDRVRTGEAIAIIEVDKNTKSDICLGFELWYKGSPENPEDYISF